MTDVNPREVTELRLKQPIYDPGKEATIDVLKITEPKLRELRRASDFAKGKGEVELLRQLLAECAGVPAMVLDGLCLADFTAVSAVIGKYLPGAEAGGSGESF